MINEDIYGQQYKNRWRDQVVMKKKTNVSSVLINQPKQRLCTHCLQSTCIVNVCGYFYDNEKEKNLSVRRSTFF